MSHHTESQSESSRDLPARDHVADPQTPSQAEGERDTVNAALEPGSDSSDEAEQPDAHRTPSQAEGSEEIVDEALEEQNR